eukprot:gene25075-10927_t
MGVNGLWGILRDSARRAHLEEYHGKVVAVDSNLWLQQLLRGMRNKEGDPVKHAHLRGMIRRIMKLLY